MKRNCVLMSIYENNDVGRFQSCIESLKLHENSSILFLAVDGPLNSDLKSFVKNLSCDSLVNVYWFPDSQGLTKRLNFLISESLKNKSIRYFFRMDADDIALNDRIAVQIKFLERRKDIDVVAAHSIDVWEGELFYTRSLPMKHVDIAKAILYRCPIKHSTVCFTRGILEKFRYNENYLRVQDRVLWADIIAGGGKFEILPDTLIKYFNNQDMIKRRTNYQSIKLNVLAHHHAIRKLKPYAIKPYIYLVAVLLTKLLPKKLLGTLYRRLEK